MHLCSTLLGRRAWTALLACLALLASPLNAPAAPATDLASLEAIPDAAQIVVHLRGIKGVANRAMAFLEKALPEQAGLAKTFVDNFLEEGIGGRKLAGLNADGPVFILFPEVPKPDADKPKFLLLLSVSNFNAFRDGIFLAGEKKSIKSEGKVNSIELETGEKLFFAEHKGFFAASQSDALLGKYLGAWDSIASKIGKGQGARLLGNDISFFVNLDRLSKDYAEAIKLAKQGAKEGLKDLLEQAPKEQKKQLSVLTTLIDPAFQFIEDSKGIVGGIDFLPEGIVLSLDDDLRAGSKSADSVSSIKPTAAKAIDKLPAGQMMYMGTASASTLLKFAGPFLKAMVADVPGAAKGVDALMGLNFGDSASAADIPLAGIEIRNTTDGAKHVEATLEGLESSISLGGGLNSSPVKGKPKVTKADKTAGGISFTRVEVELDLEKAFAGQEGLPDEMKKAMTDWFKKIMGGKINMWIGHDANRMIQITAPDWEKAETILKEAEGGKGLAAQAAYKAARGNLPDDASGLFLIDPVRYGNLIVGLLKDVAGGAIPVPPGLGKGKSNPSYIGMSASLHSGRIGADLVITSDSVRELFNAYAKPFLP
ncbi:MAG: hypothetical protein FJ261_03745 [Planctomycetes bacterium]|nr:hypothetical protein [Planctomycetota bacterium]